MEELHERGPEDERQRRIDALRALSGQQAQPAGTAPSAARPSVAEVVAPSHAARQVSRRWLALGSGLLAIVVVAAGVFVWFNRPRTLVRKPAPDPFSIQAYGDGFASCSAVGTADLAWSPDGTHIGTIGFRRCGGPDNSSAGSSGAGSESTPGIVLENTPDVGGMLGIFDTTSGKRTNTIELDTPIITRALPPQVRSDAALLQHVQIQYDHVIWSPDGKTVAVTFGASYSRINGSGIPQTNVYAMGLLLIDWRGGAIQVLQQQPLEYAQPENGSTDPIQSTLWDLRAGKARVVNVPQALAYQWTPDGMLVPAAPPLAPGAAAPTPMPGAVGNPIGGKQFTAWQAGSVNYEQVCIAAARPDQTMTCCPVTDYLRAALGTNAAWSPDGRYLLVAVSAQVGVQAKLPAPGGKTVDGACPRGTYGANLAQIPLHDPALGAIMQTLSPTPAGLPGRSTSSAPVSAQMAWSPDGRYLAAEATGNHGLDQTVLTIYDTATGQIIRPLSSAPFFAAIPANQQDSSMSASPDTFFWSADGRHLLARDRGNNVVVVFGPKSLGLPQG